MNDTTAPLLPATLADLMSRLNQHVQAGTCESGSGSFQIPVGDYYSPEHWQAECRTLFRQYPLAVAHASMLAPGQALAHDALGLPLLLVRDDDGRVRCFLNVCRHRGMRLVNAEGAQDRRTMVCPYHGWTYSLDGCLKHRLHADAFEGNDPAAMGLAGLPCEERLGLIWVMPDGQRALDLDRWLDPLGAELDWLGMDRLVVYRTMDYERAANWKLAIDAFLEAYHVRVLHRDTIYPFFADAVTTAQFHDPHIHSVVARRAAEGGFRMPATESELRRLATPTHLIFPNIILIWHPDYLSLITLYPAAPDRLRWVHTMLIPPEKSTPDWSPHWEKTFGLIEKTVFQAEDLFAAEGIQRGLKSGANTHLTVGKLEFSLRWFHQRIARAIAEESAR